jgi:hypothetical protein
MWIVPHSSMQFPLLYIHISRGTYADDVNLFF